MKTKDVKFDVEVTKAAAEKEWKTYQCSICGENMGGGYVDHSECSAIKQELFQDSGANKKPVKQLSKKQADATGIHYSKLYR